jgi:hypothetical protein
MINNASLVDHLRKTEDYIQTIEYDNVSGVCVKKGPESFVLSSYIDSIKGGGEPVPADLSGIDSISINSGKPFPLKEPGYARPDTNGNVRSPENKQFSNCILAISVKNARLGKVYSIQYQKNAYPLGPAGSEYGWTIIEADENTWLNVATLINFNDPSPALDRTNMLQKITLVPLNVIYSDMQFEILLDCTKLPVQGSPIFANSPSNPGWSWIIDPINYSYRVLADKIGAIQCDIDMSATNLKFMFDAGTKNNVIVEYMATNFNGLFDINSINLSDKVTGQLSTVIRKSDTDWISPLQVRSNEPDNDGSTRIIYTGGNHGSTGSPSGNKTAYLSDLIISIDGWVVPDDYKGKIGANEVIMSWCNNIYAYNTITLQRPVLKQYVYAIVRDSNIQVTVECEALENITVIRDNGFQTVNYGFSDILFYNGVNKTSRELLNTAPTSGTKTLAPDAFGYSVSHPLCTQFAWLDKSYELGDGSFVSAGAPLFFVSGDKAYTSIVRSVEKTMELGESYSFRGGYSWGNPVDSSLDSIFRISMEDKKGCAYANTDAIDIFLKNPYIKPTSAKGLRITKIEPSAEIILQNG